MTTHGITLKWSRNVKFNQDETGYYTYLEVKIDIHVFSEP